MNVMLNGYLLPLGEASLPLGGASLPLGGANDSTAVHDVTSGEGMFETILARSGRTLYLAEHLQRLRSSLATIDIRNAFEDKHIATLIIRLLTANGLDHCEARVKLTVTDGHTTKISTAAGPTVLIEARPYDRPDTAKGWRLQLDPSFIATTEALHKSLRYRSYLARLRTNMKHDFDDAILVNDDGEVCETTIASLLLRHEKTWIIPVAEEQLPSISRAHIVKLLEKEGHEVCLSLVTVETLPVIDEIWACNSLMGAMPVHSVNDHILPAPNISLLSHINNRFLSF